MLKLILLYLTLVMNLVFLQYTNAHPGMRMSFLFVDGTIRMEEWTYFFYEHFTKCILSFIIAAEATRFRWAFWVFYWIQAADFIDFLMTYNNVWTIWMEIPISLNTVANVIFGILILVVLFLWMKKFDLSDTDLLNQNF